MILFCAGAMGFRARRDAAGRAPGDCSAGGEAPRHCFERGKGEFRLDELPQGECREIVLRVGGQHGGQEIALSGRTGSSGSKSCRRASAGRLFCVGQGAAGYCSGRGRGEFGLKELPQGERRETVLRDGWGMGRRQEVGLSGRRANPGSKTYRRASTGRWFCVGEQRRGRWQDIVMGGRMGS